MSNAARVYSIEALEDFKVAFVKFRAAAAKALDGTEQEIRRILDVLDDRARYWQRQVRERGEEVVRAKSELTRRKWMSERGSGPGYSEQEEALELAERRLQEAEEKLEKCRRWARQLPHDILEYEGPARQLAGMLDTEVRQAIALLEGKLVALEAYLGVASPGTPSPPEQPAAAEQPAAPPAEGGSA